MAVAVVVASGFVLVTAGPGNGVLAAAPAASAAVVKVTLPQVTIVARREAAQPVAAIAAPRVVELPQVIVVAQRQPRMVELPQVTVTAAREPTTAPAVTISAGAPRTSVAW